MPRWCFTAAYSDDPGALWPALEKETLYDRAIANASKFIEINPKRASATSTWEKERLTRRSFLAIVRFPTRIRQSIPSGAN